MQLDLLTVALIIFAAVVTGFAAGWFLHARKGKHSILKAEERVKEIVARGEAAAAALSKEKLAEVREEWERKKQDFEKDAGSKRNKLQSFEQQLSTREENLERKVEMINRKDKDLTQARRDLDEKIRQTNEKHEKVSHLLREENQRLERIAGLTSEDAKKMLVENLVQDAKSDAAQLLKEIRDTAKTDARKEAQKIIVQAIQRTAADHCVETTVSVLHIENEEMKGEDHRQGRQEHPRLRGRHRDRRHRRRYARSGDHLGAPKGVATVTALPLCSPQRASPSPLPPMMPTFALASFLAFVPAINRHPSLACAVTRGPTSSIIAAAICRSNRYTVAAKALRRPCAQCGLPRSSRRSATFHGKMRAMTRWCPYRPGWWAA